MPDTKFSIEIHFQEGFVDDEMKIIVSGKLRHHAKDLNTKLMLGLADIVTLEVKVDELIEITGRDNFTIGFKANPSDPFVTISKKDKETKIGFRENTPGYL